jgi:hypothetical protein
MDANQLPRMFSFGLAGMVIGSLSAELHHCRRRRGPASADLTPRRFRDFVQARDVGVLGAIGVLAAGVIVAAAAAGVDSSSATAGWAAASAGVVVLVAGLQWRVVTRRRPALRPELRQADDLMRRLAVSHGLAHPGITLGLGLLGQALLAAGMPLAGVICWLLAVGSWWTNRAVGLDHLLREPPPPFRT